MAIEKYRVRGPNCESDTASNKRDARRSAREMARSYAERIGGRAVWCDARSFGSDYGDTRCVGGYAVIGADGRDVAEGAAVIEVRS